MTNFLKISKEDFYEEENIRAKDFYINTAIITTISQYEDYFIITYGENEMVKVKGNLDNLYKK